MGTGILVPKALRRSFFDARMCWMTGVTKGCLTVDIRVVEFVGPRGKALVRCEVDKIGRLLFEEIDGGSHDEIEGGLGFLCFGQFSME